MRLFLTPLFAFALCAQPPGTPAPQAPQPREPFLKKTPKGKDTSRRILIGVVRLPDDNPAERAVVRLTNQRTGEARAFITQTDGKYRFDNLERETIFFIVAESGNLRSRTRSLTPFDSRDEPYIDLALEQRTEAKREEKKEEKKK